MITVSLRSIAKALQGATDGLCRTAFVLAMAFAFSAGAQVITKDTLKAAEKQIVTAAAEQKDATKALEKVLKAAREATADLNAAKQHLADLEAQLAKAPADGKAKLAGKVQAAKDEVMELDAARARSDGAVTAARQRLTTATQKTLDAEANARSLDGKYTEQLKKAEQDKIAGAQSQKDEAAAAAKRLADQKTATAAAEAKRVADEKMAAAEATRLAGQKTAAVAAEAKRVADEKMVAAEAKRLADQKTAAAAAEAKRVADEKMAAAAAAAKPAAVAVASAPATKPVAAKPAPAAAASLEAPVAGAIILPTPTTRLTGTETPPLPPAPVPAVTLPVDKASAAAEAKRLADQKAAAAAEAKRLAADQKAAAAAEAKRVADQKAAAAAEAKRLAADQKAAAVAEAKRVADQKAAAAAATTAALAAPVPGAIVPPKATGVLTGTETAPLPAAPAPLPVAKVEPAATAAKVPPPVAAAPTVVKVETKPTATVRAEPVSGPFIWGDIRPAQPTPTIAGEQKITVEPGAIPPAQVPAAADKIQFDVAMVSGDKAILEKLDVWKDWSEHITFNPVSIQEIKDFHAKLMKALAQEGYVFATITFPTRVWNNGIFLAKVDGGPLGNITNVKGNRYYSASQIVSSMRRTGLDRFDYTSVYGDLFDLNAKPDLQVNMKLKPIIQDGRRVMNADLEVEDKLPLHGAFEVSNSGTKATNDWRMHSTISYLNLTKHDDVLSLDWITSPSLADVNAWSGGYFLPIDREYSLSLFGGWSTADINNVMPLLDVHGTGYFAGGQVTKTYAEDMKRRIQISAGWLLQRFQNKQEINNVVLDDRDVGISMPSITVGYVAKQLDSWHGKNFFSNTIQANFGGQFGSSQAPEFNAQGTGNAKGDFIIDKFQLVRFQRLFQGDNEPGKWTLMLKVDGQIPSDPLIAGLRKSFGGADSVRGYREQEESFDEGYVANLELHTPLLQNFIPGLKKSDEFLSANPEAWQQHRLLFLVFADYGYGKNRQPLPGEPVEDSFYSVGAGLRFGFTKYSNLRLDYGFPLSRTEESKSSTGRAHLSFQLQF